MSQYRDLLPVVVEREDVAMPDGYDSWGIKSTWPDLRTRGGYQWPYPGGVATCDPTQIRMENRSVCPSQAGDGLCVASSWRGMASGGIPASTLLLVAYRDSDVLGRDSAHEKLRCREVAVVAVADGQRLLREAGRNANLYGANLTCVDLSGADLCGANLIRANLIRANLSGANLIRANLSGANLIRANLSDANLIRADLTNANLHDADLACADLTNANLHGAGLACADLACADLSGADLSGADLSGADLCGADLYDARGVPQWIRDTADELGVIV